MSLVDGSPGRQRPAIVRHLHRRWAEQGIDVLLYGRPVEPGVLPQLLGNRDRVARLTQQGLQPPVFCDGFTCIQSLL
jgi:hypothetical protein